MAMTPNTPERILRRLIPGPNGCLLWPGAKWSQGYGCVRMNYVARLVHRIAFEAAHGPIPKDREIHHRCGNKLCANPDHLEAVTRREHVFEDRPMIIARAAQTHCLRGHEFNQANTRMARNGTRHCRACRRALDLDRYHKGKVINVR